MSEKVCISRHCVCEDRDSPSSRPTLEQFARERKDDATAAEEGEEEATNK